MSIPFLCGKSKMQLVHIIFVKNSADAIFEWF